MEKRLSLQQMMLEQLAIYVHGKKISKQTHTLHKKYLKMGHRPKCKTQKYKNSSNSI